MHLHEFHFRNEVAIPFGMSYEPHVNDSERSHSDVTVPWRLSRAYPLQWQEDDLIFLNQQGMPLTRKK